MVSSIPAQYQSMISCANRLLRKYKGEDLAHNAHGIFRLAFDCSQALIRGHDCDPLALRLSSLLVDHYCEQYEKSA